MTKAPLQLLSAVIHHLLLSPSYYHCASVVQRQYGRIFYLFSLFCQQYKIGGDEWMGRKSWRKKKLENNYREDKNGKVICWNEKFFFFFFALYCPLLHSAAKNDFSFRIHNNKRQWIVKPWMSLPYTIVRN